MSIALKTFVEDILFWFAIFFASSLFSEQKLTFFFITIGLYALILLFLFIDFIKAIYSKNSSRKRIKVCFTKLLYFIISTSIFILLTLAAVNLFNLDYFTLFEIISFGSNYYTLKSL